MLRAKTLRGPHVQWAYTDRRSPVWSGVPISRSAVTGSTWIGMATDDQVGASDFEIRSTRKLVPSQFLAEVRNHGRGVDRIGWRRRILGHEPYQ